MARPASAVPEIPGCAGREVLGRIGDKWSLYVVHLLGAGTKRFSELRRQITGITPRMLTVTIRSLERDGLISRTVYPVVPPRVEYALTPLGESLLEAVTTLLMWADAHIADINAARDRYDRTAPSSAAGEVSGPTLKGPGPAPE
jgi:DNA-binding HxlR family transcriptional regulator